MCPDSDFRGLFLNKFYGKVKLSFHLKQLVWSLHWQWTWALERSWRFLSLVLSLQRRNWFWQAEIYYRRKEPRSQFSGSHHQVKQLESNWDVCFCTKTHEPLSPAPYIMFREVNSFVVNVTIIWPSLKRWLEQWWRACCAVQWTACLFYIDYFLLSRATQLYLFPCRLLSQEKTT